MARKITIEKIIKSNPHINPKEIECGLVLVRAVEKLGVKKRDYDLAPPFLRRIGAGGKGEADLRTVHIGRQSG
jgi:hypothetical protein